MKLRKDQWEQKTIGQTCSVSSGGTPSKVSTEYWTDGTIPWLRSEACKDDVVRGVEEYISELGFQKSSAKLFKANTTLIALVGATIGKTAFVPFETTTNQNVCGIYPLDESRVFPRFLFYACQSFYAKNFSRYTGFKMANLSFIKALEISLPPLEEQKQIASLFQSIETAMEQVDGQEKNLLQLKNKLLRDLFSEIKEFGKHLTAKDFETVRFDKIAINISERVEPKKTELTTYVGLEHLDSDNLVIERTGTPDDVIGTKLKIYKGDIIFGKRRAYLRKVAVSLFDGIASAHSMILRANEKHIEKDFLPYFMQSDAFMNRAVQISEGSLSPTIKVKTLAQQEFTLPKKEKQKELVELFKQFDETRQQLKQQKATLKLLKQKLLNEILG
jgi:type I restriction enzyme S subunit